MAVQVKAQPHCKVLIFIYPDFCDLNMITLNALPFGNFTPPTTFSWTTGETTQSISVPNASGSYGVTITDAVGCTAMWSVNLDIPTDFNYYLEAFNNCPGYEMSLGIIWNGFSLPENMTYQWSNGATTANTQTFTPGYYEVTITDPATGCSQVLSKDVEWLPGPSVDISGTLALCTGETGVLTANGGPYNFIYWEPTQENTESITISSPGSYNVMVTNEFNCSAWDTVDVISSGSLPLLNGPFSVCDGGSETITVTNAALFSDFAWTTGESTPSITVTDANNYTVTVTDLNGCTAEITAEVTGITFVITESITLNTSCTAPNGGIDLTMVPPGSYTFGWSNGASTEDIINQASNTYTVTVTDFSGCSTTATYFIPTTTNNPSITLTPVNATCGQNNGAVQLDVSPPGSYTFSWSNGASSEDLSNLLADTYNVTVTDVNNCIATAGTVVLNNNVSFSLSAVSDPNTSCLLPNGAINLSVNPPGAYIFAWTGGATTEDLFNLSGGTYNVTVTDAAMCTTTASFEVVNNTIAPAIVGSVSNATCGQANGIVMLDILPAGSYTFDWTNGAGTEDIANLLPDNYTVTVTGQNGCTASATFSVGSDNTSISITGTVTDNSSCSTPNGGVNLTILPPGSYDFEWSNGANTEDLTMITGGSYLVTVTDAFFCTATAFFNVVNSIDLPSISAVVGNAICGQANGSIDVTVAPAGAYFYAWSGGQAIEDLTNIPAGNYALTVTDANGCSATSDFIVPNEDLPFTVGSATGPNTSCSSPNGFIDLTVLPSGIYTFSWSNGANTQDLNDLIGGNYFVTVTSQNGCTMVHQTTVANDAAFFTIDAIIENNTSCTIPNGSVNLSIIPVASYSFSWTNGLSSEDISSLTAGNYSVTVTDATACSIVASYIVADNTASPMAIPNITNSSCGLNNGAILLDVPAQVMYSYLWTTGATSKDLINLQGGSYGVTITNENGCLLILNNLIINPSDDFSPSAVIMANTSCNNPNGSIDLTIASLDNYTYLWSNGALTQDLVNLTSGNYYVTITNGLQCEKLDTFFVPNGTNTPIVSASITNANCNANNGSILLDVSPPGIYTYLWTTGATTKDLSMLTVGSYGVTVSSSDGCTAIASYNVGSINTNFNVVSIVLPDTSCVTPSGSVDLRVTPPGIYNFLWSTGAVSEDLINVPADTFVVTISDGSGCNSVLTFEVKNQKVYPVIDLVATNASCGKTNGKIDVVVVFPLNHTFLWSNGSTLPNLTMLAEGDYKVTVTNLAGCSTLDSITLINTVNNFSVNGNVLNNTFCSIANGSIDLSVLPNADYTFDWTTGATSEDLIELIAGSYTVTVTDTTACSLSATFVVSDDKTYPQIALLSNDATCDLNNGSLHVVVDDPTKHSIEWSNGAIGQDLFDLPPALYTVTVTNENGCAASESSVISNVGASFVVSASVIANTSCTTPNGSIYIDVNPPSNYNYLWSDGTTTKDLINKESGIYSISVFDDNGCISEKTMNITSTLTYPSVDITAVDASCGLNNGSVLLNGQGLQNYFYLWSNGSTNQNLTSIGEGTYTVIVTDTNGCTTSAESEVQNTGQSYMVHPVVTANTSCGVPNGSIFLNITPVADYLIKWSNGASSQEIVNLPAGNYRVTVSDDSACSEIAIFSIEDKALPPQVDLLLHPPFCSGGTGWVEFKASDGGNGNYQYSLDGKNFASGTIISPIEAGDYLLTIMDEGGCTTVHNLSLKSLPNQYIEMDSLISLEKGEVEQLNVVLVDITELDIDTVLWSPMKGLIFEDYSITNLLRPLVEVNGDQSYVVTIVLKNGCEVTAQIRITEKKNTGIYAPNVILPEQGQTNNGYFYIISKPGTIMEINSLRIYDRWGNLMFINENFQPDVPQLGWKGDFNGVLLNPGVFAWIADIQLTAGGNVVMKGDVTVIR